MPTIPGPYANATLLGWHLQTNPWGSGSLTYGTDYTMSITYDANDLANHPTFHWTYPPSSSANRWSTFGYPEIQFGNSPWNGNSNSVDPLAVFPVAVADLASLKVKYDVAFTGDTSGSSVAFELWLTNVKGGGMSTVTNEIMVNVHLGPLHGTDMGVATYTSGTFTGQIYNNYGWNASSTDDGWTFTSLAPGTTQPGADQLSGWFDVADLLAQLKTLGVITGNEYVCNLDFGAEITYGTTSMTFNQLEYDVQTKDGLNTILGGTTGTAGNDRIQGSNNGETLTGLGGADQLYGFGGADTLFGGDEHDTLIGGSGNDALDGGSNIDTAVFSGNKSAYTITQGATGTFIISGTDGTDTLSNVEYAKFDDQTVRLLPGTGTSIDWSADPSTYMTGIRDFDGNDLGGTSNWKLIGTADVNGDGTAERVLFNQSIQRWAEVGTESDGKTYFSNYSWAGDTRVVGIYIDPLVTQGIVQAGSDVDSQRRFQNDLAIDNIHGILGVDDYNHDGLQEIYFSLTDGTAYLHAYMHADGNIQYANYQNRAQMIDYLTSNGWSASTYSGWFPAAQSTLAAATS